MATFVRVGNKSKALVRKQGFPARAKTFLRLVDALKHYFKSCERRNLKPLRYIQTHSRIICKALGHLRPYDLNVKKQEEYIDSRLKTVSPASVKHKLGIIKRPLAELCNSKGLTDYQLPAIRPPKISNARSRRLKSDELVNLLSVISNYEVRAPIQLAIETGMRRGELITIEARDITTHAHWHKMKRRRT